jgi:hypothetical protein
MQADTDCVSVSEKTPKSIFMFYGGIYLPFYI